MVKHGKRMIEHTQRLRNLAIQYANTVVPPRDRYNDIYWDIVSGKLVELAVQECISVAQTADNEDRVYAWYAITEHFGLGDKNVDTTSQ